MKYKKSIKLYKKAEKVIPGGVNSPVRAFKNVGMNPLFIKKAKGSRIYDIDGNKYIDYVSSWGPLILGHAHKKIINEVQKALKNGTSFGAPTREEIKLAQIIIDNIPSIESVRLVNSGTEAAMSAVRLARAYTNKNKIIKFEGCYHGHCDSFLIKAGSGATTLGHPSSPGVTKNTAKETLIADFNNIESVANLFKKHKDIAAVIVEPIPANMGTILPENNFLENLAKITRENNALLIFDEVISGFRITGGSAQKFYHVLPDITTLGKIIGGGFPIGAYGARKEIMDLISPIGPVYQAGTLSGNPIAVTAGLKTLEIIQNENIIEKVNKKAKILNNGIKSILKNKKINIFYNHTSSISTLFFTENKVNNYKTAVNSDTDMFKKYFKLMLENGIYIAPSQFEASFVSSAHTKKDIYKTLDVFEKVIKKIYE